MKKILLMRKILQATGTLKEGALVILAYKIRQAHQMVHLVKYVYQLNYSNQL